MADMDDSLDIAHFGGSPIGWALLTRGRQGDLHHLLSGESFAVGLFFDGGYRDVSWRQCQPVASLVS